MQNRPNVEREYVENTFGMHVFSFQGQCIWMQKNRQTIFLHLYPCKVTFKTQKSNIIENKN